MGDPNTETTVVYIIIYSTETVIILKAVLQGYKSSPDKAKNR
jgi:hypothetical protein